MKSKSIKFMVAIIILAVIVIAFFSFYKGSQSNLTENDNLNSPQLIEQGKYLATLGDCTSCHTVDKNQPFAGGHPLASPVGTIYATNITPDKKTGIGNYTLADFDNAVRYGITKEGHALYPAMPYPSYAKLSDDDIKALYAYFMYEVKPMTAENKSADIPWPLNMKWPLNAWRLIYAPKVIAFDASKYQDPEIARGAYLTQGLAHCGACHTPRAFSLNEKAYDESNPLYLSGANAPIDGWVPVNLHNDSPQGIGQYSAEEIATLLLAGRNEHSAVFGGMADVVNLSLQYINHDDALAIAKYLKTLAPINADNSGYQYDKTQGQALYQGDDSKTGAAVYLDNCAACHRTNGLGYAQVFPKLAGNTSVNSDDPTSLINIVLEGSTLQGTVGQPATFSMPSFSERLSNQEIADVLSFIRSSWGNQEKPITANEVEKLRTNP